MGKEIVRDLFYAWRVGRKRPAPPLLAILALTLGIGVGTAVFSIVNAVTLQPLPYKDAGRVVMLWNVNEKDGFDLKQQKPMGSSMSVAEFLDWQRDADIFEHMVLFGPVQGAIRKTEDPDVIFGYSVSPGLLPMLGVTPLIGSGFPPEEEKPGASLMLLQHEFWKRRFHGDPGVIGQKLYLSDESYLITGVMPPEFVFFNRQVDFLTTVRWRTEGMEQNRPWRTYRAMARLKPGLTIREAQRRADAFSARMAADHPKTNRNWHVLVIPCSEDAAGEIRPGMLALLGAVACVILITCANVANLLLVQALARGKELAVRSALGAGRWRLVRQLTTESMALAVVGGTLGLALAYGAIRYFQTLLPDRNFHTKYLVQAGAIHMNLTVVLFAIGVTLVAGLLSGMIPALRASKPDFNQALKDVSRGSAGGRRGRSVRDVLVIAEVAVAVVLVVAATLLARSLLAMYGSGPGFRPDRLLSLRLNIPVYELQEKAKGLSPQEARALYRNADRSFRQRLYAELKNIPDVDGFASLSKVPINSYYWLSNFEIEGYVVEPGAAPPRAIDSTVHADCFRLIGIPLIYGRLFGPEDRLDSPPVAIVSREFARRYLAGEDPAGKRLRWSGSRPDAPWIQVVGMVGDVREDGMDHPPQPYVYFPEEQGWFAGNLILRGRSDPMKLLPLVRRAVRNVDPRAFLYRACRMTEIVRESTWRLNYSAMLLGGLAGLSLLLAVVGVYGVLSFSVRERTREIGVRMALGGGRPEILWMVLKYGLRLAGCGVIIGLVAAALVTRLLKTLLYGVTPLDPATFAGVAVALLGAAFLASYLPAERATRLQPMHALRYE
jgi:putative ABC transport system permease protein